MQLSGQQAFKTQAKRSHCGPERHAAVRKASIQNASCTKPLQPGKTCSGFPEIKHSKRNLSAAMAISKGRQRSGKQAFKTQANGARG